jgi:hypothetical protein
LAGNIAQASFLVFAIIQFSILLKNSARNKLEETINCQILVFEVKKLHSTSGKMKDYLYHLFQYLCFNDC